MKGLSSGRWRGNDFNSTKLYELEDKTLGIIGLGNIGKKVARRAKAFDMHIKYYDINRLTTDQEDALGVRFALFTELLKMSDIVTLHVPLDLSTHNLIGEKELAMMKPTAILINTCRGPVVDEKALYDALRDETDPRRRARRDGRGATKARPRIVHPEEHHFQPARRRPDLGQPLEALAQRLR